VESVLELGCGDGAQLKLARYPQYTGVDVSPSAVARCRSIFELDANKGFFLSGELPEEMQADLTISLDVVYHLVEDNVFDAYMKDLFRRARRFVIVYSSNRDASWGSKHVRHREFTAWVERNEANWYLKSMTPNRYPYDAQNPETSFADFFVFARG
jgi:SAM-dependent methyltransferase